MNLSRNPINTTIIISIIKVRILRNKNAPPPTRQKKVPLIRLRHKSDRDNKRSYIIKSRPFYYFYINNSG